MPCPVPEARKRLRELETGLSNKGEAGWYDEFKDLTNKAENLSLRLTLSIIAKGGSAKNVFSEGDYNLSLPRKFFKDTGVKGRPWQSFLVTDALKRGDFWTN
jgi:hypothetical protein